MIGLIAGLAIGLAAASRFRCFLIVALFGALGCW